MICFLSCLTFALIVDVSVVLGNYVEGRVLHKSFIDELLVVIRALLLPQSSQAGRSKGARMTG